MEILKQIGTKDNKAEKQAHFKNLCKVDKKLYS